MTTANQPDPRGAGARSRSRFGPRAIIKEASPTEDAHVLPLFGQHADGDDDRPAADDRRLSRRYQAVEQRAWLGWWSQDRGFAITIARLDDISQGGARLVAPVPPPVDQILWLCLGSPGPAECVQAKVLAALPSPQGDFIIRIAFGAPCPTALYRIAIYGLAGRKPGEA
jgi:hypothetical protein